MRSNGRADALAEDTLAQLSSMFVDQHTLSTVKYTPRKMKPVFAPRKATSCPQGKEKGIVLQKDRLEDKKCSKVRLVQKVCKHIFLPSHGAERNILAALWGNKLLCFREKPA